MEKTYREEKITELLYSMSSDFDQIAFMHEYSEENYRKSESFKYKETDLENSFVNKAQLIYKLITAYLESLNLHEYLQDFKTEFSDTMTNSSNLLHGRLSPDGDAYSITVSKIWTFLTPFEFSQESHIDKLLKQTGVSYLERILRNTQVILNELGKSPDTETKVYNTVKFAVRTIFPSAIQAKSGFFKSFKNYEPDILIPEIHTAVEYKYANTEAKLNTQIEQVIADTKGYTGDRNYEIFYAVFYVTNDFWGLDKFNNVWKEMKFPKNWKGIYIIGK